MMWRGAPAGVGFSATGRDYPATPLGAVACVLPRTTISFDKSLAVETAMLAVQFQIYSRSCMTLIPSGPISSR